MNVFQETHSIGLFKLHSVQHAVLIQIVSTLVCVCVCVCVCVSMYYYVSTYYNVPPLQNITYLQLLQPSAFLLPIFKVPSEVIDGFK